MLEWAHFGQVDKKKKKKKAKAVRGLCGPSGDNEPWTEGKVWVSSALEGQTHPTQKITAQETRTKNCYRRSNLNIVNTYLHWRENKGNFTKLIFLWVDYSWYLFLLSTFSMFLNFPNFLQYACLVSLHNHKKDNNKSHF